MEFLNAGTRNALAAGAYAACVLMFQPAPALAQCMKQSPAHSVALVELYTSEGCDSCPPADRWLSGINGSAGGHGHSFDSVVPLSLHVDYWDGLGWKDRFASARFTGRQHRLAELTRAVVYTPGVFVDLREFRNWRSPEKFRDAISRINSVPARASIRLELGAPAPAGVDIKAGFRIANGVTPDRAEAFLALFESRLQSDVKAGENRGTVLKHDYVVREWVGPIALERGAADIRKTLALPAGAVMKNMGVAAFVQDAGSRSVLQATAMAVCG